MALPLTLILTSDLPGIGFVDSSNIFTVVTSLASLLAFPPVSFQSSDNITLLLRSNYAALKESFTRRQLQTQAQNQAQEAQEVMLVEGFQ